MKLHLECERTIHFQKVDGTQGVLKEGAQAYMHFITSKKIDIWMRATVLELHDEGLRVQSDDGLRWNLSLIHISEPTRLGMISYAVFCLKKKKKKRDMKVRT